MNETEISGSPPAVVDRPASPVSNVLDPHSKLPLGAVAGTVALDRGFLRIDVGAPFWSAVAATSLYPVSKVELDVDAANVSRAFLAVWSTTLPSIFCGSIGRTVLRLVVVNGVMNGVPLLATDPWGELSYTLRPSVSKMSSAIASVPSLTSRIELARGRRRLVETDNLAFGGSWRINRGLVRVS